MKLFESISNHMVNHLLQLCISELGIEELPEIIFVDDDTIGTTSFGEFDGNSIRVATKNRHPMDVMRTLAHELVHWKQRLANQELDGSDGSQTENEANATAGVIMRKFGHQYPEYFVNSLPSH